MKMNPEEKIRELKAEIPNLGVITSKEFKSFRSQIQAQGFPTEEEEGIIKTFKEKKTTLKAS